MISLTRTIKNINNWLIQSGTLRVDGFKQEYGFSYEEWLNSPYLISKERC
jgi:hypothetical protein